MASIILTAAQRANADVAGHTYVPELPGQTPGSPVGKTATEVFQEVTHGTSEGLGFLAGGVHPESVLAGLGPLNTAEVAPTDSRPGKLGGLVPRPSGTLAPGPAGAAATVRSTYAKVRLGLLNLFTNPLRPTVGQLDSQATATMPVTAEIAPLPPTGINIGL
jgi:hypothetical protein